MAEPRITSTRDKALCLNLDGAKYGTFAEIGAGQETAAWFFRVGGASGTIAKTISAYDMTMSDAIYGSCSRYVSRERLTAMLDHEYSILVERLGPKRGATTTFFAYCNTVRARAYSDKGGAECHGWLGIRLQTHPQGEPNDILLHVRMMDDTNLEQQRALGVVGVNLVYAALHHRHDLKLFIESLRDDLPEWEMEVDMLKFSGPDFAGIDNREVALQLVESNLTDAAFFTSAGEVMQASETLYKKPVLVLRGSFNPPTLVHVDMLSSAATEFKERLAPDRQWIELMEFSINNLFSTVSTFTHADFLQRATALQRMGKNVLVSKFGAFHRLGSYLSRYTQEPVGLVLSLDVLEKLFEEKWYDDLPGGILENFGRLFKHQLRLYVYPVLDRETAQMRTVAKAEIPDPLRSLYAYLTENQRIVSIAGNANRNLLEFWTTDIRRMLAERDPQWKNLVPAEVAEVYEAGMAKPEYPKLIGGPDEE
ncbi:MAG TPA: TonB-dependent receptor [Verrucomicrobiales bacterium]|nr:TonB-dependent receptor [Verrucomicrobiales bacterium]